METFLSVIIFFSSIFFIVGLIWLLMSFFTHKSAKLPLLSTCGTLIVFVICFASMMDFVQNKKPSKLEKARNAVTGLYTSNKMKNINAGTEKNDISKAKAKVDQLHSGYQKDKYLSYISKAKKQLKHEYDFSDSSSSSSSSSVKKSNEEKFQEKINSLNKGTAQSATYDKNSKTVTWVGYDAWESYSDSDLQKTMDILQTITYRQSARYNVQNINIVVKTPDGNVIATASNGSDLNFAK